ncbi:preprotein translocase subunit YajC [Flavobacteriaceae bacterium Ap0902]|nr:preprotein translocase subunit YajC [Flavobacteriaceae bacterium Ap0902]
MGGDSMMTFVFFGLMFVVMYFFMIRPQMQRQKKEKAFQESLKVGDRIVTTSGIHGKVSEISEGVVTIETNAGKIRFEKSAVSQELTNVRYGKKEK